MVSAQESTTLLVPAEKAWTALLNVPRWWPDSYGGATRGYKDPGWSADVRFLGGEAQAMRFGAFEGAEPLQSMHVSKWEPPRILELSSDPWDIERAPLEVRNLGTGPLSRWMRMLPAYRFRIRFDVESKTTTETLVKIEFELEFLTDLMDLLYRFPAGRIVKANAARLARQLPSIIL